MKFINKVLIIRLDDTNQWQNLHGRLLRHDQISDSLIQIRNQRIEIGYFLERVQAISDTRFSFRLQLQLRKTDLACGNVDAKKVMFFTTSSNICCNAPLLVSHAANRHLRYQRIYLPRVNQTSAAKFLPQADFIDNRTDDRQVRTAFRQV